VFTGRPRSEIVKALAADSGDACSLVVSASEARAAGRSRGGFDSDDTKNDIIQLGGRACRVQDLFQLSQGAKQILFESGELLTMHTQTRLAAVRMMRRR
jgi:hypothetical protein